MMPGNPKLIVDIITNASKANAGIDQATSKFGKFNSGMQKLVGPATAVLGGITALGVVAVSAASDLQQAAGGVEAVFGDSAAQIKEWAAASAASIGLSSAKYQTAAAQIGAQLKNLGVPMDLVAGKTNDLITLGADLAATYGGTTEEAVSALGAAFRGEADPAERYGLALNQTKVNAELAAKGQDKLTGSALSAAKAQTIMELATKQAGGAVGQSARENDTLAKQQAVLAASIEDAAAALGTALLPVLTPVVAALGEFAGWVKENTTLVGIIIGVIAALAAAVIAYTIVQWALNVALTANPIGLIITGIILLIAAFVALFIWIGTHTKEISKFFDEVAANIQVVVDNVANWFKSVFGAVASWFKSLWTGVTGWFTGLWNSNVALFAIIWNGVKAVVGTVAKFFSDAWRNAVKLVSDIVRNLQSVFTSVFNAIMAPIKAVIGFFGDIVSAIQNVISWLGKIKVPDVFGAIGNLFGGGRSVAGASGFSGAAVPLMSGRALTAVSPSASIGAGSGGGTVININGGLDSADTIARRVRQVLNGRDRREGGIRISRSAR